MEESMKKTKTVKVDIAPMTCSSCGNGEDFRFVLELPRHHGALLLCKCGYLFAIREAGHEENDD